MKQQNIFDYINVDGLSLTPKYMQLANSIQDAVNSGKLKNNGILPSLHELTYHLEISKETADRGYKYLRDLGVLSSIPGKGHFVTVSEKAEQPRRVFMLLDNLGHGRKRFYEVFSGLMGDDDSIDLFVYNDDFEQFKKLLRQRKDGYSHYVVVPNLGDGSTRAHELINELPKDKLILVDRNIDGVQGEHGAVYENLKRTIYKALESQLASLRKYHTIKILSAPSAFPSPDITWGFNLFCQQHGFDRSVEGNVTNLAIKPGEVFICLKDDDLVTLVERINAMGIEAGKDVGIISFNETPLKKYILNGITTISTDFEEMGIQTARMVMKKQMNRVELESRVVVRESV